MENKETLLTVVVTVYNVAEYLARCIESILRQSYQNIEVILINDGSADGSESICDEYARTDKRIMVIHKKNEGVVSARYQGVKNAHGTVITFVDGDDWIETDMYEHMMSIYQKVQPDMVSSGLIFDWKGGKRLLLDGVSEGTYKKDSIQKEIFAQLACSKKTKQPGITASVCCKLFNADLLGEIVELIDPELTLGEDGAIVYCFIGKAKKIVVLHKAWYHYEQHDNSANRTFGIIGFEKLSKLKKCLVNGIKKTGTENLLGDQVDMYVKGFLFAAIKDVYDIELRTHFYLFPFEAVPKGSRIIIYGAGNVGCSYLECLKKGKYAELSAWVDKDYKRLQELGYPVESLDSAIGRKYDYIVIAIDSEKTADEIRNMLIKKSVSVEKIVWRKGTMIF